LGVSRLKIIDLSQPIFTGMTVWPGHLKTYIFPYTTHEETKRRYKLSFETRGIILCDHGTTHVDAPLHLDPNGKSVDQLPLELFYREAVCIDARHVPPGEAITVKDIEEYCRKTGLEIREGDIVLFCIGHYDRHTNAKLEYVLEPFQGINAETARWLAEKGVVGVGFDGPAADCSKNIARGEFPADEVLKEKKILCFENLCNLDKLVGKRFRFIAFPLKLVGATASPIRPVAILE